MHLYVDKPFSNVVLGSLAKHPYPEGVLEIVSWLVLHRVLTIFLIALAIRPQHPKASN